MWKLVKYFPWLIWAFYRLMFWLLWSVKPRNLDRNFGPKGISRFVSALEAAGKIKSGAVVLVASLGAIGIASAIFRAIIEQYRVHYAPRGLTVLAPAGQGGRGKVPWTLDDMLLWPGLVARFFTGHLETFRHTLREAQCGRIELHCIHQGAFIQLIGLLARGISTLSTTAGLGTIFGKRSAITSADRQWVQTIDGKVEVTCPLPDVAILCATAADEFGNIYVKNAAALGELLEAAQAVKMNNEEGIVIVEVGFMTEYDESAFLIPASLVDYIVVRPEAPQILCFTQRHPFSALVRGAQYSVPLALQIVGFINRIAKLTPRRDEKDAMVARMAAKVVADNTSPGATINIGIGLPEEVARELAHAGVDASLNTLVETGVSGSIPCPGGLFGSGINPKLMTSSVVAFDRISKGIRLAVLGAVQVDPATGNVNLSAKGLGIMSLVGPGGAVSIMDAAEVILFVSRLRKGEELRFTPSLYEVTFSGAEALSAGKKIFYATDCGVFQLTEEGLELVLQVPGWEINDILEVIPCASISNNLQVLDKSVVTGKGFKLELAA